MTDLNWTNVESSNIEALAHDGENLFVRFRSGKVYQYSEVEIECFSRLTAADSVGREFHTLIKSQPEKYPYQLVA